MSTLSYHNPTLERNSESDARTVRALALLDACAVTPDGGPGLYDVKSQQDGGKQYHVDLHAGSCTCPDHAYSHHYCKHLVAARLLGWEQRVAQLCTMHGLSLLRLKDKIVCNIVMNDFATRAQTEAVDAINRLLRRAAVLTGGKPL